MRLYCIKRDSEKLAKAKVKYDSKKGAYKSRHSVFNNFQVVIVELEDVLDDEKELNQGLYRFLKNHEFVFESKFIVVKNCVFVFFATGHMFVMLDFMDKFNDEIVKLVDVKGIRLESIYRIDKEYIRGFVLGKLRK